MDWHPIKWVEILLNETGFERRPLCFLSLRIHFVVPRSFTSESKFVTCNSTDDLFKRFSSVRQHKDIFLSRRSSGMR